MERTERTRRNRKRRYEGNTTTRRRPTSRRRERTSEKEDTSFVHTVEEGGEFTVGDYLFEAGDKLRVYPKDKDKDSKKKRT